MDIAMNPFKVVPGSEDAFEEIWRNRKTRLEEMPGFVKFHLLRGPAGEDCTLYASHAVWESEAKFRAWIRSEQFRSAHRNAGANNTLYLGHPQFEGFEAVPGIRVGRTAEVGDEHGRRHLRSAGDRAA